MTQSGRSYNMKKYRNVIAMIFAPAAAPLAIIGFFVVVSGFSWPFNQTAPWLINVSDTILSYLGFFLIGMPIVSRLRRFTAIGLAKLIAVGAFAGAFVFSAFHSVLVFLLNSSPSFPFDSLVWGGSLGAAVALSYSLIAGMNNLNA